MKAMFAKRDALELAEREAIEPPLAAKSWKTRLSAVIHASKEPRVGSIQSLQGAALETEGIACALRITPSPLRERLGLVDVGAGDAALSVGVDTLLKRGVVELPL
jgi:hypothetical protein